jgi:hypothetical protein
VTEPLAEAELASPATFLRDWGALALIAVCGFVAVCLVCWPGFMSEDSVDQLIQARQHQFSDDHPPLMAMIWTLIDLVIPGPAGMLLLLNALYWGGLLVSFRYWPLRPRARVIAFACVAAFPPLLVNLGVIWKDILMQGALVCLLAAYLRYRVSRGVVPLIVGFVFLVIALAARHNAAAAAWPLLALLVAAHPRWSPRLGRWQRSLAALGVALVLLVVSLQGLSRALKPFVRETHFWQLAPLFDLAGMSVHADQMLIDPSLGILRSDISLEELRRTYNPRHPLSLFYPPGEVPPIGHTEDPQTLSAIARNWSQAVAAHPWAYLQTRWGVYRNMIGLTERPYIVYARIVGNPYGYALHRSELRDAAVSGFARLAGTPLFCVWLYLVALSGLLIASAVAFYRGGSGLALALSASGLLYHATYLLLSASDDYRYSLWTILCTLLTAFALPAELRAVRPRVPTEQKAGGPAQTAPVPTA